MKRDETVQRELVKQWLDKAEEDLGVAKLLVSKKGGFFGSVAFHAQQAAEKFLKAFLVHHQIEFVKTHDLESLLELVARVDSQLAKGLQDVVSLNPYGVEIRYPGDIPGVSKTDAKKAVELSKKVQSSILARLKPHLSRK